MRGGPGHICVISLVGGLWVRAERRKAAGAAPVCPVATPVDGAGGCTDVHTSSLHGVLVFAVGTAGSGSVAEATGAVETLVAVSALEGLQATLA